MPASGTSDREAYRTALDCEVLVLDDLGAHRVTDWVEDTVTSIITYRCNNRKPLIATTNLPDPDMTGKVVDYTDAGGSPVHKKTLAEAIGHAGAVPAVRDVQGGSDAGGGGLPHQARPLITRDFGDSRQRTLPYAFISHDYRALTC